MDESAPGQTKNIPLCDSRSCARCELPRLRALASGGQYKVYYTPRSKLLLSIEPQVWALESGCDMEVRCGGERIALHGQAQRRHQVITRGEHHHGIPLGAKSSGKTLIHIQHGAPVVEVRSLQAYESVAMGGADLVWYRRATALISPVSLAQIPQC